LIAIIDDDESIQASLRDLMESTGLVARCFGSAEEFLEYDLHCEAGCLIAEIQMPGMSGLELQARLKEEQCDIPIVFIASQNADSSDERGRSRVPGETVGLSTIAQNGQSST
jgi:FixJ family two-component response regulator